MILIPKHALLIGILTVTEIIAKACVLLLNHLPRFFIAKLLFQFITLFIFLSVCWYFGLEINLQYSILTLFFALIVIFRNSSREDMIVTALYLAIGAASVGYLFFFSEPVIILTKQDLSQSQALDWRMGTLNFKSKIMALEFVKT